MTSSRTFAALRAVVVAALFVWLWVWLASLVRRYDAAIPWTPPAAARLLGMALMAAGTPLALWCIVLFVVRGRGTPAPFDPPREFVASGPYRFVRNPMYLGAAAVLAGFGLAERSSAIVLLALGFLLLAHLFVVLYEEPTLERTFGDGYRRYRSEVARWWIGRPRAS